jgi:4-amino-4-deoxy-L-arabinose transferase-like glycosyltransferase
MDAKSKRALRICAIILSCAFALRLIAAFWWQARLPAGEKFGFGDSASYWDLAERIGHGRPYEYGDGGDRIFRTPGYPLLLAPLFWFRDVPPVMWARIEGAALGTIAVAVMMWLAWILFDSTAGATAGLIGAIYPGGIAASVFVLSEAAYCPLLLLQLVCWTSAWRAPTWKTLTTNAVLAGLAAGAATLVRPSHLLFTPFALSLAMLTAGRRRNLIIGTLMLVGLAVTMSPWWWRNYHVTGRFVATTLQMGASLYDGLNPNATGASDMRFVPEFVSQQRHADTYAESPARDSFEERVDHRMREAAVTWSKQNPRRVLQLAGIKFARMWSPLPNAAEFQSWTFRLVLFVSYTPLLIGSVWGAGRYLRRGWPFVLCVAPAAYLTLLHVIFVSSIRYREPAMLSLAVLAAGVIGERIWKRSGEW